MCTLSVSCEAISLTLRFLPGFWNKNLEFFKTTIFRSQTIRSGDKLLPFIVFKQLYNLVSEARTGNESRKFFS